MPRTKITSAFKAPRQVTGKEGGSGKDEVEGPLVTGRRHRKDNSEWGKRMEKELAQIEKRSEVAVQKTARRQIHLDSGRETDEISKTGDVITYVSESPVTMTTTMVLETVEANDEAKALDTGSVHIPIHNAAVGKKIAKDFGKQGIFFGEVQSVEYDSDDAEHKAPFYVVDDTDGDKEDFNEQELDYGCELALQIALDDQDANEPSDDFPSDGEEESYRPPKVCLSSFAIDLCPTLTCVVSHSQLEKGQNKKIGCVSNKRNASKEEMDPDYSASDSDTVVVKVWLFIDFAHN
jgi:hypothetical protein